MQQILLRISISKHEGAVEGIARLHLSEKKANLLGLTGLDNRIHITHCIPATIPMSNTSSARNCISCAERYVHDLDPYSLC
jgi:hypothetical protein